MKLLALIQAPNDVCFRYRVAAFADAMAKRGWTLEAMPLSAHYWTRFGQLRAARRADLVVLQRRLLPWWQLAMLRRHAKLLVYDIDDAVFLRDSNSDREPLSRYRLAKFCATLRLADALVVGNSYLESQAAAYIHQQRIHRVPTCVDLDRYPLARHERQGAQAKLVWIGSQSTLPSLDFMEPGLKQAAERLPGLELRVICDRFPEFRKPRVVKRWWSEATEAGDLAAADVGLSWLPEHPWSLGKCGLKVLQYMAAGLPVVANPLGMHRELIRDGETGFLVNTPYQLARAVQRLAENPGLRRAMGQAGREIVRRHFSLARWSDTFVGLLEDLRRRAMLPPAAEPVPSMIPAVGGLAYPTPQATFHAAGWDQWI